MMGHIMQVAVNDIQIANGANPPQRMEEKALRALMASISHYGIIVPLIVDMSSMMLIDGHRRLACAKALGMEFVPVVAAPPEARDVLFEEINRTSRQMTGREWTQLIARGLRANPKVTRAAERIRRLMGEEMVQEIAARGLAINSLDSVMGQIAKYLDWSVDDSERMTAIMHWLLSGNSAVARRAMAGGVPAQVLTQAIEANRSLRLIWR